MDNSNVSSGSYGGTSQATDPHENPFQMTSAGLVTRKTGVLINSDLINELNNVKIEGLMGMASFTLKEDTIKNQFTSLKNLYHSYKKKLNFKILSMGMSGDYKIAIECGSNLIRLGSSIFGNR